MSNTRGGRKKALPQQAPRDVHVPDGVRLQKVLATAGLGSRRACENLITNGRVEVDGVLVTELGVRVDPVKNAVHVDGMRIQLDTSLVTIALNKPLGVVSTMHDPEGRPTLAQFVADRQSDCFTSVASTRSRRACSSSRTTESSPTVWRTRSTRSPRRTSCTSRVA